MAEPTSVRFHRSLYRPEAVEEAVRAFADLVRVQVLRNPEDTLVLLEPLRAPGEGDAPSLDELGMIADELANFALAETVAMSREAPKAQVPS